MYPTPFVWVRKPLTWLQGPTSPLALFPPLQQRSAVLGLSGRVGRYGPEAKGLHRLGSSSRVMAGLWRKTLHMDPHTTPRTWEPRIALYLLRTFQTAPAHRHLALHPRSPGPCSDRFRLCPHHLEHFRPLSMRYHRIAHGSLTPRLYCLVRRH